MAHKVWKDVTVKIDNESGSITDITGYVNNTSIENAVDLLEDTALSDTTRSYVVGLAGVSVPINGFVNSTTEAIFGPLVAARTSVSKTASWGNGLKYYTGEVWVSDVNMTGNVNNIITFSATLTFDGSVSRTSVAPS